MKSCASPDHREKTAQGRPSFILEPAAGETIYSYCARFHQISGFDRSEVSSTALLGYAKGGARPDFLVGLRQLEQITEGAITSTEVGIKERTVMGAYFPLMSADRRLEAIELLRSPFHSGSKRARVGLSWNEVTTVHELRLCTECLNNQRTQCGFGYWESAKQLPGVWICATHREILRFVPQQGPKRRDWISASSAVTRPICKTGFDHAVVNLLTRIEACIAWISSHGILDRDGLTMMTRTRLYEAHHFRNETRVTFEELEALQNKFIAPLVRAKIPHFVALSDAEWMRQILRDRRAGHPVKWALLLALGHDVTPAVLNRDYQDSIERLPSRQLFDDAREPHLQKAPRSLYIAMTGPVRLSAAVQATQMRPGEIQRWLRRDPDLEAHWHHSAFEVKRKAAHFTLEGAVRENPGMGRSRIIKRCIAAVRWLQLNDPVSLDQLLPPVVAMFDKQLRLYPP